jgi:hypothetical protein
LDSGSRVFIRHPQPERKRKEFSSGFTPGARGLILLVHIFAQL